MFDPTLFLLYIDNHDDVICNIAIFADNTSFYRKCDQASNFWQQQELPAELESNLWDPVEWGRKWMGHYLRIMHLLRNWECFYLLSWIGALTWSLLLKVPLRIFIRFMKFFLQRSLSISINLPCSLVWNTVVMFGLVLLAATC